MVSLADYDSLRTWIRMVLLVSMAAYDSLRTWIRIVLLVSLAAYDSLRTWIRMVLLVSPTAGHIWCRTVGRQPGQDEVTLVTTAANK